LFNKNELSQHIKIAGFFAGRINDLKIKIDPSKKMVEFFSSSSDTGEHKSEIFAQVEGEKTEAAFNCKYLTEGIASIDDEEVVLELNGEDKPGVLKPHKKKDYIYIVSQCKYH
jgi:DNA polymerase III sliding clamp (beta) subunit (PCNA family)